MKYFIDPNSLKKLRQSGWERFFAAVGLASNAILSIAGAEAEEAFATTSKTERLGKRAEAESTVLGSATRGARELEKDAAIGDLPLSLSQAERDQLILKTLPDAERAAQPVRCVLCSETPVAEATLMEVRAAPASTGSNPLAGAAEQLRERQRIETYVRGSWGPETTFVGQWSDTPLQDLQGFDRPTCNAMAANRLAATKGGVVRSQNQAQRAILKIMDDQLEEFSGPTGPISTGAAARRGNRTADDLRRRPGWREGFDNLAIRDYLRSQGAKVTELDPAQNSRLKLRHIWSALEKDYGVKVIIDFSRRSTGAVGTGIHDLHAVVVEGVVIGVKNGRPAVNAVRVYDSNVGRLIEVPARIFDQLLARDYAEGIMTLVTFAGRSP